MMTLADFVALLPLVIVVVWTLIVLVLDLWIPADRKGVTAFLSALGLAAAMGVNLSQSGYVVSAFNGMAIADNYSRFLSTIFLLSGIAGIGIAYDYIKRMGIERGEYYLLIMLSVAGMMLMSYAYDLIIVFLALELLSLPLYILAGFARSRRTSEEASIKYFLLGTFAVTFVVYGISLVYGATSYTNLGDIINQVRAGGLYSDVMLLIGSGMLLLGFSFKAAIVPFHGWVPDVYQGSPSPVVGFMSIGAKAAGITALLRVFVIAFPTLSANLTPVLYGLAVITMILGNVVALSQRNIKRLLAYSSIANGGYLLMAFVPYGQSAVVNNSVGSMLFYLLAYALTNFAAWGVAISLEHGDGEGLQLEDYAGLGKKSPILALTMVVAMLSYTGIPLTIGFWGKFYLFRTAIQGGFIALAVIGLITSVASAYYYLRVIVYMYMHPGDPVVTGDFWLKLVAVVAALAVIGLSFIPGSVFNFAVQSIIH